MYGRRRIGYIINKTLSRIKIISLVNRFPRKAPPLDGSKKDQKVFFLGGIYFSSTTEEKKNTILL